MPYSHFTTTTYIEDIQDTGWVCLVEIGQHSYGLCKTEGDSDADIFQEVKLLKSQSRGLQK
jgi:hypothetical protein